MMPTVTVVTRAAASAEDLSERDYLDIYQEVTQGRTLRAAVALLGCYSPTWWNQYSAGDKPLTRKARQALRRVVGLPELPPTVGEAVADVSPDAAVFRVGETQADTVIMLGEDAHGYSFTANGGVTVHVPVTGVTGTQGDFDGGTGIIGKARNETPVVASMPARKPRSRNDKPSVRMARDLVDDIDADKRPGESREDVIRRWRNERNKTAS